jgi:ribosomal protein S12 methylthiotransferase
MCGYSKNLVDSDSILTQLSTECYEVTHSYDEAKLAIVYTCGFIDSVVQESLDTMGEALAANGQVLVTSYLVITDLPCLW